MERVILYTLIALMGGSMGDSLIGSLRQQEDGYKVTLEVIMHLFVIYYLVMHLKCL